MGGKAQARFIQRSHDRLTEYSDAYERGKSEYGVSCIYCEVYFVNKKVPENGGFVCKKCRSF